MRPQAMAAARLPGPECGARAAHDLEDGTSCRHWSPLPGPVGGPHAGTAAWQHSQASSTAAAANPGRPSTPRLKALGANFASSSEGRAVAASFGSNATASERQLAIETLVRVHAMPVADAAALTYDAAFKKDGVTEEAKVRIGSTAFQGSVGWLACIVFHELLHCSQFGFYARHGVSLLNAKAEPRNAEPLRLLYALDELECWRISALSLTALGLNAAEAALFAQSMKDWEFELDEPPLLALANGGEFTRARRALIARLVR
jgi:hypothetical protein